MIVELGDVHKAFGSHAVLNGLSFHVSAGEVYGLVGPNGAGKTTAINILCGLLEADAGRAAVGGRSSLSNRHAIGVVPQEMNFSVFETPMQIVLNQAGYYGIPRASALERAEKYLTQLGLWEKRNGISRELSGGMKRRLMIARALMHEPRLLILDEPTAGVDIEIRRSMWEFVRAINEQGTTIILTTHYLEEAESLCRNIAIIDQGEVIENTSTRALLAKLQREVYVLDLQQPLEKLPEFGRGRWQLTAPTTIEVDISKEQGLNGVFRQLNENGIRVQSMRNKSNRLEQLFLDMVEREEQT